MMGKKWNVSMICHDWNSGSTSTHLCKIYGFSSPNACNDRISKWRKEGWPFQKKTEEKQLTQSEEITAGAIRQTRGDE